MPIRTPLMFLFAAALTGCATPAIQPDTSVMVAERYTTRPTPADNIDSVTTWESSSGQRWLIASAKDVDQLVVFDAETGAELRRVGRSGAGPGEMERPNGLTVIDDLLFVVERDNHRVQLFQLPDFKPLLIFGAEQLQVAYGIWVRRIGEGYEAYVTDSFQLPDGTPPALEKLDQRVEQFRVLNRNGQWLAESLGHFGATDDAGALRWVESIIGDVRHNRLMIAEEYQPVGSTLRVYDLEGRYQQTSLDTRHFVGQAEGIALWACGDGSGYWLATDQRDDGNRFQIFDRETLQHVGSFAGRSTRNTDGIHIQQRPSSMFPAGVFFAVHDDQAVSAFDWRDIARAAGVRASCQSDAGE